jgi:murein DD-endopeptidase MepM/ murein hydrolase activator NlpD
MLGRILLLLGLPLLATPALALTIYKYTDANGVVTYSDQAAAGAQVFVFRDRMVEKLDTQVKLETRKHDAGDPRLIPKPYKYPLPWQGGPFRLTQGANGQYSHFTPKGRYAVDIAMPEGTPIVAARGGMVVKIENEQSGRGNNPAGNFVRIMHDDGTMGVYLHLMKGSVAVREGQRIETGTRIARSGNTGNSTGPHLHFVVQRNVGLAIESIPFDFSQPVNSLPNFAVGGE